MFPMDGMYVLDGHTPRQSRDIVEWGRFMEQRDARRVAMTDISPGVYVSTVFLGIDHSWSGPPPLLFETMIFGGEHDGYGDRYSTWEQAEAGHRRAVVLAGLRVVSGGKS